ncbi:MAG: hypothetical protein PVG56_07960, partial [Anaerolineae bacterium]
NQGSQHQPRCMLKHSCADQPMTLHKISDRGQSNSLTTHPVHLAASASSLACSTQVISSRRKQDTLPFCAKKRLLYGNSKIIPS